MKPSALVFALLSSATLLAGCPARTVSPPPHGGDPLLTADGHHFAATRTYKGECMPAGTRGGCYSVTLEPDGSFRHVLLDAAVSGSYSIDGDQVALTPNGDAAPSTMTLSSDRSHLDDMVYEPAVVP